MANPYYGHSLSSDVTGVSSDHLSPDYNFQVIFLRSSEIPSARVSTRFSSRFKLAEGSITKDAESKYLLAVAK